MLALLAGVLGLTAAPAQAAVEPFNPFEVNQGFGVVSTGDVSLGNGELEGSLAAFGTLQSTVDNYPIIHNSTGMSDYVVPDIDGDATRILAQQFVGTGNFDHTNRDDAGTAGDHELNALAKFADTSNLTAAPRGNTFTRLTNSDSTGDSSGNYDLERLPWDEATWEDSVSTLQPQVSDYFPDTDALVERTNSCLTDMYADTTDTVGHELTVTPNGNGVTVSGFSDSVPNWVSVEDVSGQTVTLDPVDWAPTAQAPLVVRVTDPTDTIGAFNVPNWSATPEQQQAYARYVLFDASQSTAAPLTITDLRLGAIWAPGVDLTFTGEDTTNGQWFADDVIATEQQGGGEIHQHDFLGQLLCETDAPGATFQMHKEVVGDAAGLVPDDTEFTVEWEVTAGPDAGQTGELTLLADGTVVDGPALTPGDEVTFTEVDLPEIDGVVWGDPTIDPDPLTLDDSGTVVDVAVTNTANPVPTGGFAVLKAIDGTGADLVDPSTEFAVEWEVTEGPDVGDSGTLTVPADGTIVDGPQDLVDGDVVTFSEPTAPDVDGTTYEGVSIDPESITIDTSATETPLITVTNTYDLAPATFQIHKVIGGDAADLVPDDTAFTVEWEVTAGPDAGQTGELSLLADGTVVDGPELLHGDEVTFTEVDLPEIDGVVWGDPTIDPNPLTLDAETDTVDVEVTNTANPVPTGGFAVLKAIDGTGADLVDPSTEFAVEWEVTEGPDVGDSGTLTVPADGTIVDGPQDLVDGDVVTFSEPTAPDVDGTTYEGVSIDPESITIDTSATETPLITVTNTYDLAPATFQIHKVIGGDAADLVPDDTAFTVEWEVTTGPDAGQTGSLTVLADGTVVDGPQLLHGDEVTFTEVDLPEIDGVVWGDPTIDPNPLTLDAETDTVDVEVTNTARLAPATFSAHKVVTGGAAGLVPPGATFALDWEVTAGPNDGRTGTLQLPASGTLVDGPELSHGDVVTFTEATPPAVPGVVWGQPVINPGSVTLDSSSEPVDVIVTNTANAVPTSGFGVLKAIDGTGADLVDPSTEFSVDWRVTGGPDAGRAGTLTVPADGTLIRGPQDLRDGDVVTFSEPTAPDVEGTTYEGATIAPASITIDAAAAQAPVIRVTNTYDLAPATFQIHKVVTGGAADLVPDDTEFTVEWEVTDGPDAGDGGNLTLLADGTVVDGPELGHGDVVTFTEVDPASVKGVRWGRPRIDPRTLTLDAGADVVDVTVTNTAKHTSPSVDDVDNSEEQGPSTGEIPDTGAPQRLTGLMGLGLLSLLAGLVLIVRSRRATEG